MKYQTVRLRVNGEERDVAVKPFERLNDVLRATLLLTGTKRGCDTGGCGACTVIVGGRPIYSCMMPAIQAEGKEIVTIEGLARAGKLDPIQEARISHGGIDRGVCTAGAIMSAIELRASTPS